MKITDFSSVPMIKDAFYLHYTMHLYLLIACNEEANTICEFVDQTNMKMAGTLDHMMAVYKVMEQQPETISVISPLYREAYQLLWYTTYIKKRNHQLKIFQVWISEPDDELFVVHPDQDNVRKGEIRILAASYNVKKPKFLYYNPPENSI